MTTTPTNGGYISATSAINLADGGLKTVSEMLWNSSYPQAVGNDLKPINITSIESAGSRLVTIVRTEGGAGIEATDDHPIILAVPQENGYTLRLTALSDIRIGDLVVVNPSIEGEQLKMNLSPVSSITPAGIEEVYAVFTDAENHYLLINGIINLGWGE